MKDLLKGLIIEYKPDNTVFNNDCENITLLKNIIDRLNLSDKTIILLYIDCQSFRKLGAMIGVSHMTIRREVNRIKQLIINEYDKRRK